MPSETNATDSDPDARLHFISGTIFIAGGLTALFVSLGNDSTMRGLACGIWLIVPPIHQFLEFHYFKSNSAERLQHLRESQEKLRFIWTGFATLLVLLYLKD